jgi:putative peptidoglycan lipid II flippase
VLFPALSRFAARADYDGLRERLGQGMRLVSLMLIPAAAATIALSTPITRLIYQHGAFGAQSTHEVSTALFWFSFSLPFSGLNLLLTRTFFSLQQPWLPTTMALGSLVVNLVVSLALYKPFGIAGPVIGTAVASAAMMALQARLARRELGGRLEGRETGSAVIAMCSAATVLGAVAWIVWAGLDQLFGRSVIGQIISVGGGLALGTLAYARAVLWMQIGEAHQAASFAARRIPAVRDLLGLRA